MLRSLSVMLAPGFGRQTKNPLLKGQDLAEVIQFCVNSYVTNAFDMWAVESIEGAKSTKKSKALFRASLVHLLDMVSEACEDEDNSVTDKCIANKMILIIRDIVNTTDDIDTEFGRVGAETHHDYPRLIK
jgi:hypothetical protein